MRQVHCNDGRAIDSAFSVEADGDGFLIYLESRGGGRNNEYRLGLEALLTRAAELGAELTNILVASRPLKDLPASERGVAIEGASYPIRLSAGLDMSDLAGRIGKGQAAVGREPGAKGDGNRTKRIEISLRCEWPAGDGEGLEARLGGGTSVEVTHGIPSNVQREHLLQAIAWLDEGREHLFSESVKFDVMHEGRRYPPKAVVGLASEVVDGRPRGPASFHAGVESTCFRILEKNGFAIVPKAGEPTYPDEIDDAPSFEGSSKRVAVNRYERDLKARQKCIDHYGSVCQVCGFDFARVYGDLGAGFIHVHHVVPIAQVGERYEVDPIDDLRPVCPNCHAMLHRRAGEAMSLETLRALLEGRS